MPNTSIHWFSADLRLSDNPALTQAAAADQTLLVYIWDPKLDAIGEASKTWLHHSLQALNDSVAGNLNFFIGDTYTILTELVERHQATTVTFTTRYEPDYQVLQDHLCQTLACQPAQGAVLWNPRDILKSDGTPYRVFTPFYRKGCLAAPAPRDPLPAPSLRPLSDETSVSLDTLNLLPTRPWGHEMMTHWEVGESAALHKCRSFIESGLSHYKEGRNFPAQPYVSRLSPHLHFGELSPNQAWAMAQDAPPSASQAHFLSELGWREFSYYLLTHFPTLPTQNFQAKFDAFKWENNTDFLNVWQTGQTGIPIVDAGMRELWQTGYMHNRVRMIVGSFLVKNLLIDWRLGADWFWDCLVDADLASNSASWQWVAGTGADAAPYFRIFNPVTQGQKFDPDGTYTRQYVPELAALPAKYLFNPWEAPPLVLLEAGVQLGATYPRPLVDLKASRHAALEAFAQTKL